ncbi:MAG TPA: hypothetical protein VFE91_07725, partial [Nitrososphaerales archaeon]|nr:hypothetical protein [Nitrososphaerales archaeon]
RQTLVNTRTQAQVLGLSRGVPIEDLSENLDLVQRSLREGRAYLRAVAYPWGVELDVVREGNGP